MKLLKRILVIVLVVVVVLVLVGGGAGYWFVTKSHPQIDGTLQVKGLKSKVEIVRDSMGVPHIYAGNADDLFFAQGYVQAQDRLWQMQLYRLIGHGRTAELSGSASSVNDDKFLRTLGLARAARADVETASEEETRVIAAFAAGVNAFIDSHRDNLPLEFTLVGIKPEPWQPVDSQVWAKMMAFDLGGNRSQELLRSRLIEKFGAEKAKELMPPYPAQGPFVIPPEAKEYKARMTNDQLQITNSIGVPDFAAINARDVRLGIVESIGSNNWVVDGTKTTTGKPLLANDPHLSIQIPAIWYAIGLHCQPISADCPYNVMGMALTPTPGIIIGHNDRIAWGVTNVGPDVQDYFIEKVNPQNPNQYEFQGKWEDFRIVNEVIKAKGKPDVTIEVKISRHGPLMTPVLDGVTQPLALQWTALRERSHVLGAILKLNRARNFDDFRDALKLFDVPSQNFIYADIDGNIGYQMPGNVPIRAKGDGSAPVPGWSGEYEWKGYIPFDELPFVYNPPTHYIITSNQQVVPSSYKYLITNDWSAPYRAMRINEMIKAKDKLSPEDFKAIQGDVSSIPLQRLQKNVVPLTFDAEDFLSTRALEFVKNWDGRLTTDSVGGAILEATYQRLVKNTFANKMDANLFTGYYSSGGSHRMALLALLDKRQSEWWDDPATPQKETRDDILKKSYQQGVDDLGKKYGDAPGEWRWGRLHTATFAHPVGSVQPLNLIFNVGPIAVPGDGYTVNNSGYNDAKGFAQQTITSLRWIMDVGDWDRSMAIHTTGQSGQPFNKHYSDMVLLWRDVQYVPFYFTRSALDKVKEGVLILQP
jgi:penicillin amidase